MQQIQHTLPSHQASTGTIIDTPTQRIVAVLFEKHADALEARSRLERHGFSNKSISVFTSGDAPVARREHQTRQVSHQIDRIVPVLTTLGVPDDVASYYRVDVRAGMTLLSVVANERAQDALNLLHGEGDEGMDQATEQVLQNIAEHSPGGRTTNDDVK